ncbi:unnamed protein product [Cuscuta campestris]|uniref:Uncharacterized protein n=1 Tax=Cuscuta campestris TaxID=132261 RepID=A0A484M8X8_9ASTE|nr:unnamed protein product [Cuscuta campestris]
MFRIYLDFLSRQTPFFTGHPPLPFDHAGVAQARASSPQPIATASFARGPPSASAPPTTVHLVVLPFVASTASVGRPRHRAAAPPIAAVSPSPEVRRSSPSSAANRLQPSPLAQTANSCRSATVAGIRHRRRIQPLPRIDIAGRLTSTPD